MKGSDVKKAVKERYGQLAKNSPHIEMPCCGSASKKHTESVSKAIGYSNDELNSVPEGANLGLGCGNPTALASLKKGETVLDLGSGAGFDCFLAAKKVGRSGRIIGVDMTPEMISKAEENARKGGYENVEFRLGEIEKLPVEDNSIDVVISNCVINLSPDKSRVFKEVHRVLKPNGRIMVSDIVLLKELPRDIVESIEMYVGCIGGATTKEKYLQAVKDAGFEDVEIIGEMRFPIEILTSDPNVKAILKNIDVPVEKMKAVIEAAVSVKVRGTKGGLSANSRKEKHMSKIDIFKRSASNNKIISGNSP